MWRIGASLALLLGALLGAHLCFAQLTATGIGAGEGNPGGGGGGVTFDAAGLIAFSGAALQFDYTNLTVGTANAIVACVWNNNQENFSSVTWDQGGTNQALTFIGRVVSNSGIMQNEIWGITNASLATGPKTLRAIISGVSNDRIYVGAASFRGVNGTFATAFQNFNSNKTAGGGTTDTTKSVSITSASGHIVLGCGDGNVNANTITMNNTQIDSNIGGNNPVAYERASGAGSVTVTATVSSTDNLAVAGVDISP